MLKRGVAPLVLLLKTMHASKIDCLVTDLEYLSPHILRVQFQPTKPFKFAPGQFLSIVVPGPLRKLTGHKRCYSFALNPKASNSKGYEICVKLVANGKGSEFLKHLRVGDRFKALAPFGDFKLRTKDTRRNLCLISTGTGIAPFRSMLGSEELKKCHYQNIYLVHGTRYENEVIFSKEFQRAGVQTHFIVSQPSPTWAGRQGYVMDLLKELSQKVDFSKTDFYVCGNGNMVSDVCELLARFYRVETSAITRENFSSTEKKKAA